MEVEVEGGAGATSGYSREKHVSELNVASSTGHVVSSESLVVGHAEWHTIGGQEVGDGTIAFTDSQHHG